MVSISTPREMGATITRARHEKNLTQSQVATKAGVSRQLVNRLEMGTAQGIALEKLLSILHVLNCSLFVEYGEEDQHPLPRRELHPQAADQTPQPLDQTLSYHLDESLLLPPQRES